MSDINTLPFSVGDETAPWFLGRYGMAFGGKLTHLTKFSPPILGHWYACCVAPQQLVACEPRVKSKLSSSTVAAEKLNVTESTFEKPEQIETFPQSRSMSTRSIAETELGCQICGSAQRPSICASLLTRCAPDRLSLVHTLQVGARTTVDDSGRFNRCEITSLCRQISLRFRNQQCPLPSEVESIVCLSQI